MADLLTAWLEECARESQLRADRAAAALKELEDKDTEYARATAGIARAHAGAAAAYRLELAELGKGA